jgi:hypothetical protein
VLARGKRGNASSSDAERVGSVGTMLADRGWELAQEAA